jgi:hypothetical protein
VSRGCSGPADAGRTDPFAATLGLVLLVHDQSWKMAVAGGFGGPRGRAPGFLVTRGPASFSRRTTDPPMGGGSLRPLSVQPPTMMAAPIQHGPRREDEWAVDQARDLDLVDAGGAAGMSFFLSFHHGAPCATGPDSLDDLNDPSDPTCKDSTRQHSLDDPRLSCNPLPACSDRWQSVWQSAPDLSSANSTRALGGRGAPAYGSGGWGSNPSRRGCRPSPARTAPTTRAWAATSGRGASRR